MEKRGVVSNTQIAMYLIAAFVSYHLMDLPKDMVAFCNTGGWVTLLIIGAGSFLMINALVYIMKSHPGRIITDYLHEIIGVRFARIVFISSGLFYFFYVCKKVRVCSEIVKFTVLPNSTGRVTMLLSVFLIFYALNKGFSVIVRSAEIITILCTIVFISLNAIFAMKVDLFNIRPFFVMSDVPLYIKGVTHLYNRFIGFDVLLFIPLSLECNKHIKKTLYKVVFFLLISYIAIAQICIGIIGFYDIGNYDGVFFVTSRIISIEGLDFLRRLDGLLYFSYFLKTFVSTIIYSYISIEYLKGFMKHTFKGLLEHEKFESIMYVSFAVLCYFVSFATDNLRDASYYLEFLSFVLLFFTTVIPLYIFYELWCRNNLNGEGGGYSERRKTHNTR